MFLLGSLLVYVGIVIEVIVLGQNGFFHMTQPHLYELYAVAIFLAVLAFWKHRENIKSLLSGTEQKHIFHRKIKRNRKKQNKNRGGFLWQKLVLSGPETWGTALAVRAEQQWS